MIMIIIGDQVAPIFVGIQISLQLSWDPWANHWKTNQPTKDVLDLSTLIHIWISLCCYMDLSTIMGPVGRPLEDKPTKQR